jgi:hypothetical protein
MKKNSCILCLIILLVPGVFLQAQKTGYIARAVEPPSIDGIREDVWNASNSYPIEYNYNGTYDGPADLSSKWYGLWDTVNLYLLVEVTDDMILNSGQNAEKYWIHDCFEVFLDMLNEKNGVETGDDPDDDKYQYRFIYGLDNEPIPEQPPVEGIVSVSKAEVNGYIIEIKMPWATLTGIHPVGPIIIGRSLGAEFQVADLDDHPEEWMPDANFLWNNPTGDNMKRAENFGTLVLVENNLPDTVAPDPVQDLAIDSVSAIEATLQWTSPGDDHQSGLAWKYEIRYNKDSITDSNWLSSELAENVPSPSIAGTRQTMTIEGLTGNTKYCFAIKTLDEASNKSMLSNVAFAKTSAPDTISPAIINDLTVVRARPVSIEIAWTAPGDDGTTGMALYYEIRYSKVPITDLTWDAAVPVINAPDPEMAGKLQSMIVIGLAPETTYYLAIRTTDEQKNKSLLSNIVRSQTTELVISSGTSMDQFIGTNAFIDDPLEKIKVAGFVREYHPWSWDVGEAFPNNKNAWNPSRAAGGNAWFFDTYYQKLHDAGITVVPCIMNSVGWLNDANNFPADQKPVRPGLSTTDPLSYKEHADHLFQYAARYGSHEVADSLLKLASNQPRHSGLGTIRYLENWNEPDRWWGPAETRFTAEELAAMGSADRDGHQGEMGNFFGAKNADPDMKLVLGGLAEANLNYIENIRQWCLLNRTDKKFVYDVINVHRYTQGISPEQGMLRETMQSIVDYRNQYLPDVEVWITEFGWDSGINSTPFSCPSIGNNNREEVQAWWIVRGYLLLSSTGIERAAQYMLRDVDNDGKTQFETCGLVNEKNDWTPKCSWYYTYTMKNVLKNTYYTGEQNSYNSDVLIYKFENASRDTLIYAVWAPTSNGTIVEDYQLNLTGKPASARQIELIDGETQGMRTELNINRNTVSITVKEKPVFVLTTSNTPTTVSYLSGNMPEIMVYPNPVKDRLIVKIINTDQVTGQADIVIHNIMGQIIFQKSAIQPYAKDTWQIDVNELDAGSYILELVLPDYTVVKKLVKIQ